MEKRLVVLQLSGMSQSCVKNSNGCTIVLENPKLSSDYNADFAQVVASRGILTGWSTYQPEGRLPVAPPKATTGTQDKSALLSKIGAHLNFHDFLFF